MLRLNEVKLPLDHAPGEILAAICQRLGVAAGDVVNYSIYRRSCDARKKTAIALIYALDVEVRDEAALLARLADLRNVMPRPDTTYRFVAHAPADLAARPVVIGTGPCGLFAGLLLAQMGFRPIILERGKAVRERTKDTWGLWRQGKLNPDSNVQFGEGGAGTFSDGKLYSQIKDPLHHGRKVLEEFVKAGAPEEILYVNKPHIGTFRLVSMVEKMRANIFELGGEVRFGSKVEEIDIDRDADGNGQVRGVVLAGGERIATDHVVLAVGHSARDTFQMLFDHGVYIEAKPFSIGVRIEHPQSLIDRARFGPAAGHPLLGAADYKLVHHCANGRTAYSFCMCPGGTVVAATSEPGRVVTNGMSQYSRAERNANSGIVVDISPEVDYPGHPLAGIEFQRRWESAAFVAGGGSYAAPAQRVGDFLAGRPSVAPGGVEPSYTPGVHWTDLSLCLPDFVVTALREALPAFDKQIRGFAMDDAVMTGVETRTSSPIRIKRGDDFQSLNTRGLYPAGEGAGYAGGILSAGVDGIKVAEAVATSMLKSV
ncbi:NAD(P)/FAD-dependent oxidoreductase [Dechloromonas denitrificans]|uniref:NAD(P)/FAD-dependent oxidoreductase n=1 Tax=Dechloromonas denitrificans TaxID=281362 RepID=UPI001CF80D43|nr:NAD(P)/FAD-dependent oxidoreductase [Dechloromonas denitrificans]UCV03394.1 NAD(P)/FAD-dependent oxidoreductase [Dechloromonas denitrificans]